MFRCWTLFYICIFFLIVSLLLILLLTDWLILAVCVYFIAVPLLFARGFLFLFVSFAVVDCVHSTRIFYNNFLCVRFAFILVGCCVPFCALISYTTNENYIRQTPHNRTHTHNTVQCLLWLPLFVSKPSSVLCCSLFVTQSRAHTHSIHIRHSQYSTAQRIQFGFVRSFFFCALFPLLLGDQ